MIQGKARYAKIVGRPGDGFEPGEKNKEWSFDLVLNQPEIDKLAEEGINSIKEKDGVRFIRFKRKAYKSDGEAAKPIKVVDRFGNDWNMTKWIGNDSVLNVKYGVREWEYGKKKGTSADVIAVQVWEHVPYEGGEQFPQAIKEDWKEEV